MLVNLFGNVKLNTEICIVKHKNKKIMKAISTKKILVSTGGWGWKMRPINAIAGCNDTGNEGDSPCPSSKREAEIKGFTALLRREKIKYRLIWGESSNVFCQTQYVVVADEDKQRATELAKSYDSSTRLFYAIR